MFVMFANFINSSLWRDGLWCLECVWNVFFMTVHLQNYKNNTEKMLEKRSRKIACWNIQRCKNVSLVTLLEWEVFLAREIPTN